MKQLLTTILILTALWTTAQNVVISESESTADASAILDVQSSSKGLLLPRLTEQQRTTIAKPAAGLLVYQVDNSDGFYFYDGTVWVHLTTDQNIAADITDAGSGKVITYTERSNLEALIASDAANIETAGSGDVITDVERTMLSSALQQETDPLFTASQSSLNPVGTIIAFAGDTSKIPDGWMICDGRPLLRNAFSQLYDVIGVNWGVGDGVNTFNVPDLRGQFLRGTDQGAGNDLDSSKRLGGSLIDQVGSVQQDAIVNITGTIIGSNPNQSANGAFRASPFSAALPNQWGGRPGIIWTFDASNQVNVGSDVRPKNAYVNYIIKF
ncbi:MAG: tail fiber protein [Cyclobacteriaceae bacterium]